MNDCKLFVAECGCGERHNSQGVHEAFSELKTHYNPDDYEFIKAEFVNDFQDKGIDPSLDKSSSNDEDLLISFRHKHTGEIITLSLLSFAEACYCEDLLFTLVNYDIAADSQDNLLEALKKHDYCWKTYRYDKEFKSLTTFLETKANVEKINNYFKACWRSA